MVSNASVSLGGLLAADWEKQMKRRNFLMSAATLAAGITILPRMSFAAEGVIDVYFTSDQNVIDFWTNVVKPKF